MRRTCSSLGCCLALMAMLSLVSQAAVYTGYMYIEDCPSIPVSRRDLPFGLKLRHVQSKRLLDEGAISLEEHQRAFPGFLEDNLCNGVQVAGSYRGGLIEFESLKFEFNSRLPDFASGEGSFTTEPNFFGRRGNTNEKRRDGNGNGLLQNKLGTIGFSGLTISKFPDNSSNHLFSYAANNNGDFGAAATCPKTLFVAFEIPLNKLQPYESLFITIVPAIVKEWHLEFPKSGSPEDVREKITFDFGSMTYSYGGDKDRWGVKGANVSSASCNLDIFCGLYPCICGPLGLSNPFTYTEVRQETDAHAKGIEETLKLLNKGGHRFVHVSKKPKKVEPKAAHLNDWWEILRCNGGSNPFAPNHAAPNVTATLLSNVVVTH